MHYLLIYDLAEDYLIRRRQHREKHLAHAWTASDRGELILGGALTDPCDQALADPPVGDGSWSDGRGSGETLRQTHSNSLSTAQIH